MQTIRQGSTGDAVSQWQKALGISQTGNFDSATLNATTKYQQKVFK